MTVDSKPGADERVVPERIREGAAGGAAAGGAAPATPAAADEGPVTPAPRRSRVPVVVASACAACVIVFAAGGVALGAFSQEGATVDPWASTTVPVKEVGVAAVLDDYLDEASEEPLAEEPPAATEGDAPAAEEPQAPAAGSAETPPASGSAPSGGSQPPASSGGAAAQPPASSGGSSGGSGGSSGDTAEKPAETPPPAPSTITVTVSVDGSKAKPSGYSVGAAARSVTLPAGATAYDALVATGLSVNMSGGYVRSIGGLAEFSCGAGSGWMYGVNGTYPKKSCTAYKLSAGDTVRWVYTLDNGNDL